MDMARRKILAALGATAALSVVGGCATRASSGRGTAQLAVAKDAAHLALGRLLPRHQDQVAFRVLPAKDGADVFRVSGERGRILVEGSTPAVQLTGFHQYLRSHAHAHFSWNGERTDLPPRLPGLRRPLKRTANVAHRFALNDTSDGYTGPYHGWDYWEHELDVLALHGFNEVLVYIGAESVYHRLFQRHGYTDTEMRSWIAGPAHQPWWLLQNMSAFGGPVSRQLLDHRLELGRKIAARLRELGMTPVLPGYFGTVPPGFTDRNPGADVVPQGEWAGFVRPDWLDPRTDHFARVAADFYRIQAGLFGDSSMYKMDLLHEGGKPGDVPVGDAAKAVEKALRVAHPGAVWNILGWQTNPRREIVDAVDKSKMLIVDGLSDRFPEVVDRETDWDSTPYAFGSIWNFGGHTTMGANTADWPDLYDKWRTKDGSALHGIALMPEAADNNPAAFALFSDLAWTESPLSLNTWFEEWSIQRYGASDQHAAAAWDILRRTAYGTTRKDSWSEAHDGLFAARPSLKATKAASWSPKALRYDPIEFAKALPELLAVSGNLRRSSAYRYDLLDVTRQVISHRSRILLPQIRAAYEEGDRTAFGRLTAEWFRWMQLLEETVATDARHLLGRWIADARNWGADPREQEQLAHDAVSVLTVWGDRPAADKGKLHDYANREWAGLIGGLYTLRWKTYFDDLDAALAEGRAPRRFDWFAIEDEWVRTHPPSATKPTGDIYLIAHKVLKASRH
ncbi:MULTISPECIES: alpha-N-acetylglucosaminidase [unclassified Streptomyces]|uniref:alpha-N-acetylglucosaminidase n=2 Tax=unclassified Streptomyces TaxID=2593676 RepID=UPI0013B9A447|nr:MULTISPECIES: alpha-N-acetylglucosaminidase [unclassified Streptomyces]NEB31345.1 alpha-N-acetylglucosaminidase [Streptomyces sp. SID14446]WSD76048.1 alpha-N-acetylglucosaminidase [Streptomyces sp. NBC_01558]WSK59480.1 alpha-N-acetylglucosaminidase [Streptomyces sp. NBC_01281]